MKPAWILEAEKHIGTKEVPGKGNNPVIVGWLKQLKAWWSDDATPWCGTYVAHCFAMLNIALPKHWYRAKDWLNWGTVLDAPKFGCVVIFNRDGGGHVGFLVGQDHRGNLMILGGNQGDSVNIKPFAMARVAGYRWPTGQPMPANSDLPLIASSDQLSTNEA